MLFVVAEFLLLVCELSSSVGLHMQDYKSLHVAVMICATR